MPKAKAKESPPEKFKLSDTIEGTDNFTWEEVFRTSHGTEKNFKHYCALPEQEKEEIRINATIMANILQTARNHLGFPIPIASWYRSPEVEKIVGGAGNHPWGDSVDPSLPAGKLHKLYKFLADGLGFVGGLGYGSGQMHLDLGVGYHKKYPKSNRKRRWSY